MDCSLPGSSVHGILQARILEWVVIPFSRGSSLPRDQTSVSCITDRFFTVWATRKGLNILKDIFIIYIRLYWASQEALAVKNSPVDAADTGDAGLIPASWKPWSRKWQLAPVFLPGEFHGQRSLAGYSPWGHKESDTTEQLNWTDIKFD